MHRLAMLPPAAQEAISSTLGAQDHAYDARHVSGGYEASNSAQALRVRLAQSGLEIESHGKTIALGLPSIGFGSDLKAVPQTPPVARGNRVTFRYGALDEWYANGALGVEQGFTFRRAPPRNAHGPLTVSMEIRGSRVSPSVNRRGGSRLPSGAVRSSSTTISLQPMREDMSSGAR